MNAPAPSKLQQLRELSVVVADTGDYDAIKRLKPVDCTTNPTLVKKALDLPVYADLIEEQLAWARAQGGGASLVDEVVDRLTVGVGAKLAGLIPGRVSTEVDADQAYDTAATVAKARKFVQMYADQGIGRDRILIKVASTWEGVEAARVLQAEGIDCNLTLIFNPTQAIACAEAGAFLISPFVGRILDWYVANGQAPASIDEDPGVVFVRGVYAEFKRRGSPTVVMGASFRSTAQIEALAGCDRLTISPDLLERLEQETGDLPRKLSPRTAEAVNVAPVTAATFAAAIDADPMAKEKLATGIDAFAKDLAALRTTIREKLTLSLRTLLVLAVLACVAGWWFSDHRAGSRAPAAAGDLSLACPLPPRVAAGEPPLQTDVPGSLSPFALEAATLTPIAGFSVDARVLSREDYRRGRESELSPTDLALGWARMADDAVIAALDIRQSSRWYRYRWSDQPPLPPREIASSSANMHMIPGNDAIAQALAGIRQGERVRIDGWLVEAKAADGWRWRSSTSRTDTGGGACEVVYVCGITRR